MSVGGITRITGGYSRHSKLQPSVTEMIDSKVFSLSDKYCDQFSCAVKELYQNPMIKPVLDVAALKMAIDDDIGIIYGATLHLGANGCYTSNTSPAAEKLAKLAPHDQASTIRILDVIGLTNNVQDPLANIKKLEFQAHLPYNVLLGTITHEFSHAMADILFDNYMLGYKTSAQKAIYEKCRDNFVRKFVQLIDPKLDSGIYANISGTQLLSFEFNRLSYLSKEAGKDKSNDENLKLSDLCNVTLFSTDAYNNDDCKDKEIFARIFQSFLLSKDFPITNKLLGEFSPYLEQVLNPSINAFMLKNHETANALGIKPNSLGSYGFLPISEHFDINEELYFAVVSDDTPKAKGLILEGADPGHIMADFIKTINTALLRGNYGLCKFILETSKNINLDTIDGTGRTTVGLSKEIGDDAYDIFKGYEATHKVESEVSQPLELVDVLTPQSTEIH